MASDEVLSRFSRERRILARLEHPHIARLLDGGATEDGRPYFVMELVEGEPITDYCRSRSLAVEPRLELLQDCCDAVAAAHRNLVVHRDLKPSNVLVTKSGEVKLLDFGIAKLLGPDDTGEAAAETRTEFRLLTPAYAAPEQILGEPVTTATDVWALGALGYELLTGTLPQKREGRSAAALAAAASEDVKEKPSQRVAREELSALPFASPTEGDRRRLERRLRGDLDTILLAALRREPERRYASVTALGGDLRQASRGPARQGASRHLRLPALEIRPAQSRRRRGRGSRAGLAGGRARRRGVAGETRRGQREDGGGRRAPGGSRQGIPDRPLRGRRPRAGLRRVGHGERAPRPGGQAPRDRARLRAGHPGGSPRSRRPDRQGARPSGACGGSRETLARDPRADLPSGDAAIGRSLATLGAVKMSKGELDEGEKELSRALPSARGEGGSGQPHARAREERLRAGPLLEGRVGAGREERARRLRDLPPGARRRQRPDRHASAQPRRPPRRARPARRIRKGVSGLPGRSRRSGSVPTTRTSAPATRTSPSCSAVAASLRRQRRSTSARWKFAARHSGRITRCSARLCS